jgi:secreted trypsin-like serine protease
MSAILDVPNYLDPRRTVVAVDGVVVDPAYDARLTSNDVALLHLAQPTSAPAMRFATRAGYAAGDYVSYLDAPNAAGWGALDEQSLQPTSVLQQAYLRLESTDECRSASSDFDPQTQVCAGTAGRAGACHGDSGGPLVAFDRVTREPVLWGITSWGTQSLRGLAACSLALPVVYSWLPAFADFVTATLNGPAPPTRIAAPAAPAPRTAVKEPAACVAARLRLATAARAESAALTRLRSKHTTRRERRYRADRSARLRAAALVTKRCR